MKALAPIFLVLALCACDAVQNVTTQEPAQAEKPLTETELQLKDVNDYRASKGLKPLTWSKRLTAAARFQALYMAENDYVGHSQGSLFGWFAKYPTVKERAGAYDYKWRTLAENVAGGQETWEIVFKGWRESPGHNANILNPDVTEIGIARVDDLRTKYKHFWAMVLGSE
jgi:uncharacterized protein YkwD